MTTLAAFCERTGIDMSAARQALAARHAHDRSPWYMEAVLAIGAWVTAIAALFFVWVVMDLVLGVDEPDLVVAIVGALLFAASVWLLHERPDGAFAAHAAVAFATAGTLLVAAGIGVPTRSLWVATIATLPLAAVAIWQQRSQLLQFLIVSAVLVLLFLAVWNAWDRIMAGLPAIFVPLGVALLLCPPRRDVRPAAFALLIVPQILEILTFTIEDGWVLWYGWPAKGLLLLVLACLFAIQWRRPTDVRARWLVAAGAVAAAIIAFLLPTGASVALVALVLAYTLGTRSLAIIGAFGVIYFIWRFYWDLQQTLLVKSVMLMVAGAILLICYGLMIQATRMRRLT